MYLNEEETIPIVRVPTDGSTVGQALDQLFQQYPDLRQHLFDDNGELVTTTHESVNILLNKFDIRELDGLDTLLSESDRLMILRTWPAAISGGDRQLVIDALRMAITARRPAPGPLHHSGRGSQYASHDYQALLTRAKMVGTLRVSRKGNCYDNAAVESFFGTLKTELVYQRQYTTRAEARADIFEYIEVFYNRIRCHSALGYKSPVRFEALPLAA